MSPKRAATQSAAVTVCVLGAADPAWRDGLQQTLPSGADWREFADIDPAMALRELAAGSEQANLLLIRANTLLPPHWVPRILATLDAADVLAVAALEPRHLPGVEAPVDQAVLDRLDSLCFVHGDRSAIDADIRDASLLAVRGAALPALQETAGGLDADALPSPWRTVRMRNLLVAPTGEHRPGKASVAGGELDLAARVKAAIEADVPAPGWPGLDGHPVILHVLHGWGGGAARWVRDFALADETCHHLLLRARSEFDAACHGQSFELLDARTEGPLWREFTPVRGIADTAIHHAGYHEFLDAIVADWGVAAVLVSSLIGHALDALRTGLPTTLVVHDHYPLWPLLHCDFGDASLRFDDDSLCAALDAVGEDFEFAHRDATWWIGLRKAFVAAAVDAKVRLVAPSHSAMAAQLRLAPELGGLEQRIIPHGLAPWSSPSRLPAPPSRDKLRLVVPGRVRSGKGARLLHAIVPAVTRHAELVLLGAGAEGMDFFGQSGVHVVLDYRHEDLPALLATLKPDAALLLPTVAETFSYTLSEMRSLGLPVLATRVGALAERIEDGVDGLLVEPDAEAVLARVAALVAEPGILAAIRGHLAGRAAEPDTAAMASAYLSGLGPVAAVPGTAPAVAGNAEIVVRKDSNAIRRLQRALARQEERMIGLEGELERRAEWGWSLEREHRKAVARLTEAQQMLEERTRWARSLDQELQHIKPLHEQMLASRSWRLTRPLRVLTTRLRTLRESLRFRWARLHSLRGRVRGSLGRRGILGTMRRIRQEFDGARPATLHFDPPRPEAEFIPFALPVSDVPRVSIVIPVFNKFEYTAACLRSLARHAGEVPFEVIVVDDTSTDVTAERLPQIDGLRVHRNAENLGFVGSCNAGVALARGEFVLFLNNDTVVTAGWLEALLRCFAERADAGLVGARLVYPDGRLQEAGGIVFADGSGWNYGRFGHPDDPRVSFRRQADYCSGAAIMLRRALFDELGGFDTHYAPAYYEDTDLAFKVRAAGHAVYVEPRAVVVHFEGISNGTDTDADTGLKRYQKINHDKFAERWREVLKAHPAPIDNASRAHLAATWRARKRVLIVDASTPTPDQDSGSVRLLNIMRLLRDMGCQVSFLPDNLARFDKYTPLLQAEGIEALYHPFVESMPEFYRRRGREFDLIMVSRHYILAHHIGLIRVHAPQARLAFDTVDLHYLRESRAAELDPRPELKRQAEATRRQELKLIDASDVTLVVSKVEQTLLATDAPGTRVEILSNVHPIHGSERGFDERRNLLFVGGFQHPPNIDAMLWFVGEVMPRVRARLPEVELDIVGSKIVPEIEALAGPGVIVHGFVEDIEPMLEAARISVAPLRYGAGVKGKVNMAMSWGLPVVATPMAVEGIDAESGRDVMIGADAESFADAVVQLYQDRELWQTLARNGVENVRRQFSFDTARRTLANLLDMPEEG